MYSAMHDVVVTADKSAVTAKDYIQGLCSRVWKKCHISNPWILWVANMAFLPNVTVYGSFFYGNHAFQIVKVIIIN